MKKIIAAGDDACLVELDGIDAAGLRAARAAVQQVEGVLAVVTGHSSLLVIFDPPMFDVDPLAKIVAKPRFAAEEEPPAHHDIDVCFNEEYAPDLPRTLEILGLSEDDFVNQLTSRRLSARYLGFMPGFAYLEGLPPEWAPLPRHDTSRQRVAAGSVGLAGNMAGIYPGDSPGGWNIIGRTSDPVWLPDSERPNVIAPGDTITFWPVDDLEKRDTPPGREAEGSDFARVLEPGQQTFVVGEPDISRLAAGLPTGGAFDPIAAATAVRAAGAAASAVLECVLVGPLLELLTDAAFAWHGATAELFVNDRKCSGTAMKLKAGDRLRVGRIRDGFRGYLSFDRGIARSGPRFQRAVAPLKKGELLRVNGSGNRIHLPSTRQTGEIHQLVVFAGPHEAPDELLRSIETEPWKVSPASDRVGVRISPPSTGEAMAAAKLLSCGVRCGTVQWHPNGDLILMGPDHPVTGGYPQPVTIARQDRWKIAHLAPGDEVRFILSPAPLTARELP